MISLASPSQNRVNLHVICIFAQTSHSLPICQSPLPVSFCPLKNQDQAKLMRGSYGRSHLRVPHSIFATYQNLLGEILQASVSGGVKDHREGFVRGLHVAKLHLILGGERKRPQ